MAQFVFHAGITIYVVTTYLNAKNVTDIVQHLKLRKTLQNSYDFLVWLMVGILLPVLHAYF